MNIDLFEGPPLILVFSGDKSMRMLLCLALEQEGYQVVEATNGEECLAAYKRYRPDAILLDLVIPGMDGFTCCSQLRTLIKNDSSMPYCAEMDEETLKECTPIVTISVLDDSNSLERAFEVGTSDYITKPIEWIVLRHRIRRLLRHARVTRAVASLLQQVQLAHQ